MANTSYQNNIRTTSIGGYSFGFDARTEWVSVSRTNNSITINGLYTRMRVNSGSVGATFSGYEVQVHTDVPHGTRRRNASLGSGTFARGQDYPGTSGNYSMTVGANDNHVTSRSGVTVNGGTGWTGSQNISIPALGAPTGLTRGATSVTRNTATLTASLTNWGNNATAGTGQRIEYKKNADSGWTNLAYNTSMSHSRNVTGLTSNTMYNVRSYALNGGGKSSTSSPLNWYTLPNAPVIGTPTIEATTATVPTTLNKGGEAYTITTEYRYREKDGTWGSWVAYSGDEFTITDLIPSAEYEVQVRSTTTAGTTEGSIIPLETTPAVKLITPDGLVNAVPYAITSDGVAMINVRVIGSDD